MSCLRIQPLIDGESKAEEDKSTKKGSQRPMQGNETGGAKTKIRKRSRRKTCDKVEEKKRIQRC